MSSRRPSVPHANVQPRHTLVSWLNETKEFLAALIANPLSVGAVLPSSAALAAAITASVRPGPGNILELGSGTGVFSREILRKGISPTRLILVEQDEMLSQRLKDQFPASTVLQVPAQNLNPDIHPELTNVATTVCGLPLLNMSRAQHEQLLRTVFDVMVPQGALYLFTYGFRCPVSPSILDKFELSVSLVRFVALNLPPASVYRLSKRIHVETTLGAGGLAKGVAR